MIGILKFDHPAPGKGEEGRCCGKHGSKLAGGHFRPAAAVLIWPP